MIRTLHPTGQILQGNGVSTAETEPWNSQQEKRLLRIGRNCVLYPLKRNWRRILGQPSGELVITAIDFDNHPEIGRIRSTGFAMPAGIDRRIHDPDDSQKDRFDSPKLGLQLVARFLGNETSVEDSYAHVMRVNLPATERDCPIAEATSGKWFPGENSLVFGRAVTPEKHMGYNHYTFMVAQAILLAQATGRSSVAAVVVDTFPLLQKMQDIFGFRVVREGNGRGGACSYYLNGYNYSVFPLTVEVNIHSVMAAYRIQHEIFVSNYLTAGIAPRVDMNGIMSRVKAVTYRETSPAKEWSLERVTPSIFVA